MQERGLKFRAELSKAEWHIESAVLEVCLHTELKMAQEERVMKPL